MSYVLCLISDDLFLMSYVLWLMSYISACIIVLLIASCLMRINTSCIQDKADTRFMQTWGKHSLKCQVPNSYGLRVKIFKDFSQMMTFHKFGDFCTQHFWMGGKGIKLSKKSSFLNLLGDSVN